MKVWRTSEDFGGLRKTSMQSGRQSGRQRGWVKWVKWVILPLRRSGGCVFIKRNTRMPGPDNARREYRWAGFNPSDPPNPLERTFCTSGTSALRYCAGCRVSGCRVSGCRGVGCRVVGLRAIRSSGIFFPGHAMPIWIVSMARIHLKGLERLFKWLLALLVFFLAFMGAVIFVLVILSVRI